MVRDVWLVLVLAAALTSRAASEPTLPETILPLRLIGTVVNAQTERSVAVIESGGKISVVRAGDAIAGAEVQEVRKDEVVLAQSGRRERLAFPGANASSRSGSGVASASASTRGGDDAGARDGTDPDFRPTRPPARVRAKASARASAVPASAAATDEDGASGSEITQTVSAEQLLVTLSGQARYAPLLDEAGKLRGVALMDVRPDSTLERIGLRSGDVVVSIAGVKVDNTTGAFDALRALDPRAGGEVLIERQGMPTRIAVPPGTL